MLKALLTALCLLLATPAWAITWVSGDIASATATSTVATFLTTNAIGDTGVACIALDQAGGARTVTGVSDNNAWTFGATVTNGNIRKEVWYRLSATEIDVNVEATFSASTDNSAMAVEFYRSVAAIGTNNTATGSSTTASVSLTTQDANNFVVGCLGFRSGTGAAWSAATGNLRNITDPLQSSATFMAAVDNTAASASSVTTSANIASSQAWAAVALELRSTVATPSVRQRSVMILP